MAHVSRVEILATCLLLIVAVSVAGCQSTSKKDTGTVIGGVLGGIIGHQVDDGGAGAVIGALLGGAMGRVIGDYMDEADRRKLKETIEETPRDQTASWHNETSGNEFEVTPTTDLYAQGDLECRKFDQVVYVDGQREVMEGIACKEKESDEWEFHDA
ncbi:MAG: glycine zipper 2TM domain-containing protein [Pseudomonadota bacterium]